MSGMWQLAILAEGIAFGVLAVWGRRAPRLALPLVVLAIVVTIAACASQPPPYVPAPSDHPWGYHRIPNPKVKT